MKLTESEQFVVYVDIGRMLRSVLVRCDDPNFETSDEAVEAVKNIQTDIHRVSLLASLCDSEFQFCLLTLTNGLLESINQVDIPATSAIVDGENEVAIKLCESCLIDTWSRWQCRMTEYQARAQALAQILSSAGIPADSVVFNHTITDFFKIANRELAAITKEHSKAPENKKLTVKNLAKQFNCSEKTIRRLAEEKRITMHDLPGRQRGKFAWSSELDEAGIMKRLRDKTRD